jgi:hypothetical protein
MKQKVNHLYLPAQTDRLTAREREREKERERERKLHVMKLREGVKV